jgi:hypothetical protein
VTPAVKREAVAHLVETYEMSERRAQGFVPRLSAASSERGDQPAAIKNWPGRFGLNEAMDRRPPAMGAHRGPDVPVSGSWRTNRNPAPLASARRGHPPIRQQNASPEVFKAVWPFRMFSHVGPVPGVVVQERPLDLRSWGRDGVGQGLGSGRI